MSPKFVINLVPFVTKAVHYRYTGSFEALKTPTTSNNVDIKQIHTAAELYSETTFIYERVLHAKFDFRYYNPLTGYSFHQTFQRAENKAK